MSDFDNFDDLDAVRDFRAGVGLMTAEVDDRIRRRIIDLAIARGLTDNASGRDDLVDMGQIADMDAEFTGVTDLSTDRGQPPTPSTSAGRSSSDGSAAVVELHAAARPPARQRLLVAAAAIVVVILVAGAVLMARREGDSNLDTANPPAGSTTGAPTTTSAITDVQGLVARIGAQAAAPTLRSGQILQTVDHITKRDVEFPPGSGSFGTQTYDRTQDRGPDGGRRSAASHTSFAPDGGSSSPTADPQLTLNEKRPFSGLDYGSLQQLDGKTVADIQAQMLAVEDVRDGRVTTDVLRDELNLLRLDITPPSARAALVQALVAAGNAPATWSVSDAGFELVIITDAVQQVRITFDPKTGALRTWAFSSSGRDDEKLEALSSRTVS